tara:strand:+ start:2010 stop:2603 length:594 start_codon:yes stop_codon:yes gene_type:complete
MATYNNIAYGNIGPLGDASGEVLLNTITASSSATLNITTKIDSTFEVYKFKFINIHPSASDQMEFQGSINGGDSYGISITTIGFKAHHLENDSATTLAYTPNQDVATGTGYHEIFQQVGHDEARNSACGELVLFNPSSTTFVKNFYSRSSERTSDAHYSISQFSAGYFNTTSAINALQFRMANGNIDSGTIKMYGVL